MDSLSDHIKRIQDASGGLRAASRITGVDAGYLKRLRDCEKQNPTEETLDKLGLKKEVIYVLK